MVVSSIVLMIEDDGRHGGNGGADSLQIFFQLCSVFFNFLQMLHKKDQTTIQNSINLTTSGPTLKNFRASFYLNIRKLNANWSTGAC